MQNFIVFLSLFIAVSAEARPLPTTLRSEVLLPITLSINFDFEGIVDLGNCSGSLIQLEAAKDTDFALVLTNGHCLGKFIRPNEYIFGRPSKRTFELLASNGEVAGEVTTSEIAYATMTKTDMAIYKLTSTYAQIKSQFGIRPLQLASQHPGIGQSIEVISGYWKRGYRCQVEAFIPFLKEGDWTCEDSIRYSRPGCEVIGGTSGSPVIAAGSRDVIGINNTGNEDGERCTENNPCEIDDKGDVTYQQGYAYGQQTFWIYSCLNASREMDLTLVHCQLPH
jgi:V8-like Glu-specific endopeptidase